MMQRYDRIWLQKEDDCHEVTWCQDRINNDDVEYIRLDLHTAALAHERQISDDVVKDNQILRGRIERLRDALGNIIGSCDCCHERCCSCTIHITIAKEALEG